MSKYYLPWLVPLMLTAAGAGLLTGWIYSYYHLSVPMRLPGEDGRPNVSSLETPAGKSRQGHLETFDGIPSKSAGVWPTFRGPNYDAVSTESVPLMRSFPAGGPRELWRVSLGEGYAGPAVRNGRVYLIDYDMDRQADAIRCFSLEDGREIWRYSYPVAVKRNHGMSRTIPAVDDRYVVTIGPRCDVTCLDADTGRFRWAIDLVREYGTQEPLWYAGQCPRIEEGKAILAPAGKDVLMMAVDCESGQVVWKTPSPRRWQMTHSSILPITFEGRRMYVYCAVGGVVGVAAEDGTLLWETDAWTLRIHVPTPVWLGDGRLFFSAGYNKGSMMMRLVKQQNTIVPEVLFALPPEVFGADQQTPIYYQGFLYGVRPNKEMVCLDTDGKIRWTSGPQNKFGLGPYIIADGMIIVLNDEGVLSLIEARPDEFVLLARAKVLDGPESWAPPALAEGRLVVRDFTTMKCLDLRRRE
ncbi:MAG TPA: PQQ-binding-like beta-propeller repeat protein [Anaerohalosphaeraceae bacterium]|nr:PQQ-binding-like beta-propeller repeat protein [Anaerohalosphaeraceae bacterium]